MHKQFLHPKKIPSQAFVAGAKESDYTLDSSDIKCDTDIETESTVTTTTSVATMDNKSDAADTTVTPIEMKIGGITFVQCATGATESAVASPEGSPPASGMWALVCSLCSV